MKLILLCAVGCAVALARPQLGQYTWRIFENFRSENLISPRKPVQTVNDFIDLCVNELNAALVSSGADPKYVPDVHKTYKTEDYTAEINLTEGYFINLSKMYRIGNVANTQVGRILTANVTLEIPVVELRYDYNIKSNDDELDGVIGSERKHVQIAASMQMDFKKLAITLHEFDLIKEKPTARGGQPNSNEGEILAEIIAIVEENMEKFLYEEVFAIKHKLSAIMDKLNEYLAKLKQ